MKRIALVFLTVLITVSGFAQKTADIGIWGGTSTYLGDLQNVTPFQTFKLNLGAYFRYNFNSRVALRAMFLTGKSAAEGVILQTPWSYNKNVQDLSIQVEINYLKYILGLKNTPFSPYITGGIGIVYFPYNLDPALISGFNPNHNKGNVATQQSVIATSIPFGFGLKYNLGKRIGVGIEYQMRKLLTDKLDNLDDPLAVIKNGETITYTDYLHNNDWSGYLGVQLTYMIYIGKKVCPAYDSKNW
ncbi:MAG: outer membrane beta-barrel protein [Prolixibacteraceae bacterium]|nr:outer membrane beta-barrel protein [Prolixibacteraceae bacterium]